MRNVPALPDSLECGERCSDLGNSGEYLRFGPFVAENGSEILLWVRIILKAAEFSVLISRLCNFNFSNPNCLSRSLSVLSFSSHFLTFSFSLQFLFF